ncbi:unnamed protein product [Owenia fusiformis]|uniref:Uncharacterized protein n=1 Tax=Owenia fusiformis TaxID=6347 RepID=A0A8J1TXL3_OWEFU|nr:unnamed protein product [Owenia fusiformis]
MGKKKNEARYLRVQPTGPKEPVKAGCYNNPNAAKFRIIHLSDTHLCHNDYLDMIPDGDILVHTGDFSHLNILRYVRKENDMKNTMKELDAFFAKLPHKFKFFIAGNHEITLDTFKRDEIQQHLTNGVYLYRNSAEIDGVKFYGDPCTNIRGNSYARAYAIHGHLLSGRWKAIDDDVDVLLTHMPPYGLQDSKGGCQDLRNEVLTRIKPKVHMFGHMHSGNGITFHDDICFSNGAMHTIHSPNVIDLYYERPKDAPDVSEIEVKVHPSDKIDNSTGPEAKCSIM